MPSSPTVIQEFVASLGFSVDAGSAKRAESSIADFTKMAESVTTAMSAMAVAVGVAVSQVAKHFEALFYAAQQGGTTVAHLKALTYGFGQIGQGAAAAEAAVASFKNALRSNPGNAGVLNALGVPTVGKDGKPRDAEKEFNDLQGVLYKLHKAGQDYVAFQYAGMFGLSHGLEVSIWKNWAAYRKGMADYAEKVKATGAPLDALGKTSAEVGRHVNSLKSDFDLLGDKAAAVILHKVKPALVQLDTWMTAHLPQMSHGIDHMTSAMNHLGTAASNVKAPGGGGIVGAFNALFAAVARFSKDTLIDAAAAAIWNFVKDLGSASWRMLVDTFTAGMHAVAYALDAIIDLIHGRWAAAWRDFKNMFVKTWETMWGGLKGIWMAIGGSKIDSAIYTYLIKPVVALERAAKAALNALRALGGGKSGFGATPPTAGGDMMPLPVKPGAFTTAGGGLPPGFLHAVSQVESGGNPNAVSPKGAEGAFQFMPGTARQYGLANPFDPVASAHAAGRMFRDLLKHYGGNLTKAVAAYNWGSGNLDRDIRQHGAAWQNFLPKETHDYIGRVAGALSHYNAPGYAAAGGVTNHNVRHGGVTNNLKTEVTVNGAGKDGAAIGSQIAGHVRRVQGNLLRNAATVVS